MQWSPQQETALRRIRHWLMDSTSQVFYLGGDAGTGKTTLAKEAAADCRNVRYGAPTGKAATVMRRKGCTGATTIHSDLYISQGENDALIRQLEAKLGEMLMQVRADDPEADPDTYPPVIHLKQEIQDAKEQARRPRFTLNMESCYKDADLVVLDEISMVDGVLGQDILKLARKVLVLGDPFQLPPVYGEGFFTSRQPDYYLTEVHRQALDSPVLWLATRVRRGDSLPLGLHGTSRVTTDRIEPEEVLRSGQVLVGRNTTRRASNARVRKLKGYEPIIPVKGDRLVCLRNNRDLGLWNGAIWHAEEDAIRVDEIVVGLQIRSEDSDTVIQVPAHACHFKREEVPFWERLSAEEFDYGYALTVHKSQGSQWEEVILFDESGCFRADARRWLYTGITRASEKIVIAR